MLNHQCNKASVGQILSKAFYSKRQSQATSGRVFTGPQERNTQALSLKFGTLIETCRYGALHYVKTLDPRRMKPGGGSRTSGGSQKWLDMQVCPRMLHCTPKRS